MFVPALRPDQAVGWPFYKSSMIILYGPHDLRKKSDWFRNKNISQKLKYLNFKCEDNKENVLSSDSIQYSGTQLTRT